MIEVRLGNRGIDDGIRHLNKIESLIKEKNESNKKSGIRLPDLKMIITGGEYGYRREDGILVMPIGCLKD